MLKAAGSSAQHSNPYDSRLSTKSDNNKLLTTYADRPVDPQNEEKSPKMAKKRTKKATVRLYRASSHSPLRIGDSAKLALTKMKKAYVGVSRASKAVWLLDSNKKNNGINLWENRINSSS